MGQHEQSVMI